MFIWYFRATRSLRAMTWIILLAIIRLPRKHAPGVDKAKLLNDITSKICNKEVTMYTSFGTFHGNFSMVANVNPNYEKNIHQLMLENYHHNKDRKRIFINVGTHIGEYLIDMAKNYGYEGYGFEPTPSTFEYLIKSIYLSKVEKKVRVYNVGLGSMDAMMFFYQSPISAYNTFCNDQKILNMEKIQVPVKRFDGMKLDLNAEDVKLILIDTEGFEYFVLTGMKALLEKMTDVDIIVEIHLNKEKVLNFMKGLKYMAEPIDSGNWLFRRNKDVA